MKKRIISLVLVFAMILPMVVLASSDDAQTEFTYAEEVFEGLGIINAETYSPHTKITRGEFATLVSKLVLYNSSSDMDKWYQNNFEPEDVTGALPESPLFSDVDGSHKHFTGIKTLVNMGYMKGIGGNVFAPDFRMTLTEGAKVVVSMLGYDEIASAVGGFPAGYTNVANKCKLFSEIGKSYTDVMDSRDAVQLLYNAFDVDVKMALEIYDDELVYRDMGESFLNFFLKLEKAEGRITDNGYTSVAGASSKVGSEMMTVGGKNLKYTTTSESAVRYIGREVTAYYSIDKSNENACIYVLPEDEVTTITDGTSFSGGVLSYTVNGKDYRTNIPRSTSVIYNGIYTDDYTNDLLTVENGTVDLIKYDGKYTIIVRESVGVHVSNVAYDTGKVYNSIKYSSLKHGKSVWSLSEGDEYDAVLIFNERGKKIEIEDIVKGDILNVVASSDGKSIIEVHKQGAKALELELDSYTDEEFITRDSSYEFTPAYTNAINKTTLTPGETYKVYTDDNGRIVWITSGSQSIGKVAVYTGSGSNSSNGFDEDYVVRLFTEDKELKVFKLPEKITVNDKREDAKDIFELLDPYTGKAVLYTAEEDILTSIVTPAAYGEEGVSTWYHVSPSFNIFRDVGIEPFSMQYYEPGDGASFGGYFAYTSATRLVFTVPTSEADFDNEKKFLINNPLSSSTSYKVEAYSTIKNDPVPEVLIIYSDAKGSGTVKRNRGLLITKVINTVDDEGESVTAFKGYEIMQNSLKEVTVPVSEDVIMTKVKEDYSVTLLPIEPEKDTDVSKYGPLTYKDLEPGDIIRYGTDSENRITTIRIAFDYSQMKGFDESLHVAWASFAGPVLNVNSKGLKLAYGIKPEDIDYKVDTDVKKIKGFAFGGSKYPLVFVEKDSRGLSFREGTYEDITSYELTGNSEECDFACILTHFTGGRMGGVIYVR